MPQFEPALPAKSPSRVSRSLSISSDRTSTTGYGSIFSPPVTITPHAAFIAASAASQIVTNDHDSRADTWFDQHGIEPSGETALVAPPALRLVNRFLDQLLFSFLAVSKSTSLATLRPAVSEVLKTKLAKSAIHGADQELHEYLGGGEDEDLLSQQQGEAKPNDNWDLELVWKRTRLRCMVYSSLGDMEEEDEDYYTEQGELEVSSDSQYAPAVVSPAVAIFLTSILEFMGEQILVVAGQSAYNRLRAKLEKEEKEGTSAHGDIADRVVVEEFDMERVAMDRTLGRIWRGWKKRVRSPTASVSLPRSFSREFMLQNPGLGATETIIDDDRRPSLATVMGEFEHAATVPLPLTDNDIREIEIPGLAAQSDDEDDGSEDEDEDLIQPKRPKSLIFFDKVDLEDAKYEEPPFLTAKTRTRSNSMPSPAPARYSSKHVKVVPAEDEKDDKEIAPEAVEEPEKAVSDDLSLQVGEDTEEPSIEKEIEVPEETTPDEGTEKPQEPAEEHKGLDVAAVGVAVVGVAAVGGAAVAAAVHDEAPQTFFNGDETDGEEFVEEPQIMTSSRVSIGGRKSPEDALLSARSSQRSSSVHSLRLIDVVPPTRTGTTPIDTGDYIQTTSLSRSNSLHSPLSENVVRTGSPVSRGPNVSPVARNGSALSMRPWRNSVESPILEEKEFNHNETAEIPDSAGIATASRGVDLELTPIAAEPVSRGPTSHPVEEFTIPRTNGVARTNGVENGVSSLTPLRESTEVYPESDEEEIAIPPRNNSRIISDRGVYGHSPSTSGSTPLQVQREQNRGVRSPPNVKSSPPRSVPQKEEVRKVEPVSRSQRSHTSGSTSSGNSHKLKPLRTSEDSGPHKTEDKGQSFEQLIRSDQTIQYTLTPQNMRNIESPNSPRHIMTPTLVSAFDSRRPPSGRSHSSSLNKPTQASPVEQSPQFSKFSKPVSRSSSNAGGPKIRPNAAQPRDPRVDRDSVNDFAEFIRSTGPANGQSNAPKPLQHRGTNGTARNTSGSVSRPNDATPVRRADSSAGRSRLQARDPVVPRGDSISDLIDFVRSGPQLDKESHRIPRTVAPFRSTMDSDQMVGAVGGKAIDASLPETRYSQATSVNSSVNSQSALLNGSKKATGLQHENSFEEEPVMPKRKTRRVRDPYAIDFSDEEDDLETFTRPKPIKEESLAEFLKNATPPAVSTVTPIYDPTHVKKIKAKTSTPSFRSRFSRKDSSTPLPPKPSSNGNDSRATTTRSDAPRLPMHTPIAAQYSTTPVTYEPTRSTYVSQVDSARNRVAQKSYQPRDALYSSSRTNELSDFLKSEPPPPSTQTQPQPLPSTIQKDEGTFHRMFGRKRVQ